MLKIIIAKPSVSILSSLVNLEGSRSTGRSIHQAVTLFCIASVIKRSRSLRLFFFFGSFFSVANKEKKELLVLKNKATVAGLFF
jgi:hypothetical protein